MRAAGQIDAINRRVAIPRNPRHVDILLIYKISKELYFHDIYDKIYMISITDIPTRICAGCHST
eukprot:1383364-Amorphochlora_amoeboformis.AAC.1